MVLFNYATRELTAKIVYYGPGLCGKTTNLEYIHRSLPDRTKGKMLSLATQTDRTLFFDFLPLDLGSVRGMKTRVQLYTVPGQVFYDATRKLVLKGADGVVFVVDSQKEMMDSNKESWKNFLQNLRENSLDVNLIPLVIQYNKRDLPNVLPVKEMEKVMNDIGAPYFEAVAITGEGVQETLKGITKLVLNSLSQRFLKDEKQDEEIVVPELEAEEELAPAQEPVSEPEPEQSPAVLTVQPPREEMPELPAVDLDMESSEADLQLEPLEPAADHLEELRDAAASSLHLEPENIPEVTELQPEDLDVSFATVEEQKEASVEVSSAQSLQPQTATATKTRKRSENTLELEPDEIPEQQNVNLPVEVTVSREGQDVKIHIGISLKIRLFPR